MTTSSGSSPVSASSTVSARMPRAIACDLSPARNSENSGRGAGAGATTCAPTETAERTTRISLKSVARRAIHHYRLTADVTAGFRREKDDKVGELFRTAQPPERDG